MAELNKELLLQEVPEPTPKPPLRGVEDFVPGHLQSCVEFWEQEILARHRERAINTVRLGARG